MFLKNHFVSQNMVEKNVPTQMQHIGIGKKEQNLVNNPQTDTYMI